MTTDPNPNPQVPAYTVPEKPKGWLSPLNQRRWRNFRRNRRALWSLVIFALLFGASLCARYIANEKPILISYRGELFVPVNNFYPGTTFGDENNTEAFYTDLEFECLVKTGGFIDCLDFPEELIERTDAGEEVWEDHQTGWMLWPPIPYRYNTIADISGPAPSPPSNQNILGTDDTQRDVVARIIYGFQISVLFTLIVTALSSVVGIVAGAVQGYFGGWTDLLFQRFIEIWSGTPSLYIIIILFAIIGKGFWLLVIISVAFGWTALVGVVRAEFLRARNFEYVRAARALGVSNWTIMFRHIMPNAMVATLTFLPFIITGTIGGLASLDFLGFGLPQNLPSLGELTRQAKEKLNAYWIALSAFFTFAIMLSLLVFIFEGVRDAFDPRKTFK